MGNSQSKLKRTSNKLKVVKRTRKNFSVAPDLEVVRTVIKKAPNAVIDAIFNGALNCRQGAVHIPPHLIPLFRRHNKHFDYLIDRRKSIPSKRHLILQKVLLFLLLLHFWPQILAQSVENLYRGLCAKLMSSFSKKSFD